MSIGSIRLPDESPNFSSISTGNVSFASGPVANWSVSFFVRINALPAGFTYWPFAILGQAVGFNVQTYAIQISVAQSNGYMFFSQPYAVGQIFHIAISVNATGNSYIYIDGVQVANYSNIGVSAVTSSQPLVFRTYNGLDMSVGGVGLWGGYSLTQSDVNSLAGGASPSTINTPVAYYSLLGTNNAVAHSGDAGLVNLGSGGSVYNLIPDGTYAGYASEVLAYNTIVQIAEAFISRSGSLAFFRIASTYSRFYLSGNNGTYNRSLLSFDATSIGSGYTNPTATISGGSSTSPAILGPPTVVDGSVVGIPIWNPGVYTDTSGVTIAISDPNGSGASFLPVFGGSPLPVTSVSALPTISVGGSPVSVNPQEFWASSTRSLSQGSFQLAVPVTPGEIVTYSAESGFMGCSLGSVGPASSGTYIANYSGSPIEPMFVPPDYTLLMGANHVAAPMATYASMLIGQDASKRFNNSPGSMLSWPDRSAGIGSWIFGGNFNALPVPAGPTVVFLGSGSGAIAVCNIIDGSIVSATVVSGGSGYPATGSVAFTGGGGGGGASGTYTAAGGVIQSIAMATHGDGYCRGIYTAAWDDTAPQGTGPYTPTTNMYMYDGSQSGPLLYVTEIASSPGTLISGVLTAISITYYVQYRPSAAYSYQAAIGMGFNGGSGNGPYTNTATNWRVTPPGNVPDQSSEVEPDGAIIDLFRFGPNAVAATTRFMDSPLPSGAQSNARHPGDVTQLSDISYNMPGLNLNAMVTAIRPYSHAVSPYIYVDGQSPGSIYTPGGFPTPYAIPAPNESWANPVGLPSVALLEMVTSVPHGFGTYQEFYSHIPTPSYISISNGQIGTVQNPPLSIDPPGYLDTLYSTGGSTILAQFGCYSSTSASSEPSGVNNASFTQGVTGSISNNGVGSVSASGGSNYVAGTAVAIDPPSGAWQTALAYSSLLPNGSVASISGVTGYGGNNYPFAPLVTVQPPSLNVGTATAACAVVVGVVQMPVVTYGGNGYTGNAAVTFYGGGGTGAAAVAVVANGKVTGFTSFSGGTGYTHPPIVVIAPPTSQASAIASMLGGSVVGYILGQPGSGYLTVVITGDGTGAQAIAWTGQGVRYEPSTGDGGVAVGGLEVVFGGSGYTHATATILGGGGSGATVGAITIVDGVITNIALALDGGGNPIGGGGYIPNYAGYPSVTVSAPAQQALVSATISGGVIATLNIVYGGLGYTGSTGSTVEIVILGTGTGASATGIISGGVLTGFSNFVGGSGYVGPNPIAVSVAPPARQAIATTSANFGALGIAYVSDPGCGYGSVAPTCTVVGSGSGGSASCTLIYPFEIGISYKDQGCIPYEVAAGHSAALGRNSAPWVNIPPAATDALVESIVTAVCNNTTPGQQVWIEYSNEPWNTGFPYAAMFSALGAMTGISRPAFYAGRAAQVHSLAESVMTGLGRGGDLMRVFGTWLVDGNGETEEMVAYANANSIRIDAMAPAPYWDVPSDYPFQVAFGSIIHDNPNSIAYNTSWPWTRAMGHDFIRHAINSDTRYTGSGQGGAPLGWLTNQVQKLAAYNLVPGQTQRPLLVGYEGSIEQIVPYGIYNGGTDLAALLERDMFYDPGMYDTMNSFFLMCQTGGIQILNFFQFQDDLYGEDLWALTFYEGCSPGKGDGSDGKGVNLFWMEANTIAGSSAVAAYTGTWDRYNNSPSLQSWRDWGAKANLISTPSGSPAAMLFL